MDPYTVFKFNFTFEVWLTVPGDAPDTFLDVYYKDSYGLLTPGAAQTYLYTKEEIPYSGIIRFMKDPSGSPVFEEFDTDVPRYVTASEPIFDYQGNVNGYRQTLKRNPPVVFRGQATD